MQFHPLGVIRVATGISFTEYGIEQLLSSVTKTLKGMKTEGFV